MRLCFNEDVKVFESTGALGDCLLQAALVVKQEEQGDGNYMVIHTEYIDGEYTVTLYVHGTANENQ